MSAEDLLIEQYRGYLAALARIQVSARPWLHAKLDGSDLAQEALLKAHAARDQFRGQSQAELVGWLRNILANTLANQLRAFGGQKRDIGMERSLEANLDASSCRMDAWLAADQTSPSEALGRQERALALAAAVDRLPDEQREVVLLKHCQGMTLLEIADRLGKTQAGVAGLLRRGLQSLREQLQEGNSR